MTGRFFLRSAKALVRATVSDNSFRFRRRFRFLSTLKSLSDPVEVVFLKNIRYNVSIAPAAAAGIGPGYPRPWVGPPVG